jgi:hypothetical protein
MQDSATLLRTLPAEVIDDPRPGDAWERCTLSQASDRALVDAVAAAITPPKVVASSSFVLHAPMELIARARLLGLAPSAARPEGRRRIAEIAVRYARAGPEVEPAVRSYADEAAALNALTTAIPAANVDEADGALGWLLERSRIGTLLPALADAVIAALGAAAHAPILLSMFLRSPELGETYGALLRAPLRYLTLQRASRLTWPTNAAARPTLAACDLTDGLLSPPHVDSPSASIAPTMLAVEADGLAERLLAGPTQDVALEEAERALLRIAAWSMLQDDPAHAPYGWTHCLTMPQGVLALAAVAMDRCAAIRVAATHVLGFRATLGRVALDPQRPLPPVAAPKGTDALRATLAGNAVAHPDAHLAKYTLACFDAADRDPEAASLFLAAAAYLHDWWGEHPDAGFGD